ncbi:IS110 family transposase [Noviherbaspirillum malthae]|uniref:IS110 family transposase n=1 Tax=Noviherbaspirillum malthae TaxID=1260987 RepID=UPI001E4E05CC|nr:IS110 family transposase [Noviherbaspirillum malthae]
MRNKPMGATVYGIDLGKNTFHIVGVDPAGKPIQRITLSRATIFNFFSNASRALIGMEACPGSQWLARKLEALGHQVRIIPAQFVKPYVKSNKSDIIDAAAIAEAVARPTMRFVRIKSTEQAELQAMHRIRDRLMSCRTQLINQVRAFCLEFGIPMRTGPGPFKADLPNVLADEANDLTPVMRELLGTMSTELGALETRISQITRQIDAVATRSELAMRLATIPGIGYLSATAILAAVGDGKQFAKARDLAAWLGLVPAQYSTGGKANLLGASKRGNPYVRRLLIHGARTCVLHLNRSTDRLGVWIARLESRMHINKVVVALANKLARVAWIVLTRPGACYLRDASVRS